MIQAFKKFISILNFCIYHPSNQIEQNSDFHKRKFHVFNIIYYIYISIYMSIYISIYIYITLIGTKLDAIMTKDL